MTEKQKQMFVEVVEASMRMIYRAKVIFGRWQDAEDIMAQVIQELWQRYARRPMASMDHLHALLMMRLRDRCTDAYRREPETGCVELEGDEHNDFREDASMLRHNLLHDGNDPGMYYDVRHAVESLPIDIKPVITSCYLHGFTQCETGRKYKMSRDQVVRRLRKGREGLKKRLRDYRPSVCGGKICKSIKRQRTK